MQVVGSWIIFTQMVSNWGEKIENLCISGWIKNILEHTFKVES